MAIPFAIRIPLPTPEPSRPPKSSESPSTLEAWKRGWSRAEKKVVIGDGAEWIWNLADLYHARQHLWELARKLFPLDEANQKAWMKVHQERLLDAGKIKKLVIALRYLSSDNPAVQEKIRIEADCSEKNAERMHYPKFRRQHLSVGSGVIERLQNRCGFPSQAVRHVLDRSLRQRYPRPSLQLYQ